MSALMWRATKGGSQQTDPMTNELLTSFGIPTSFASESYVVHIIKTSLGEGIGIDVQSVNRKCTGSGIRSRKRIPLENHKWAR